MKTATVAALIASLSAVNASLLPRQDISSIPQCALTCALGQITGTGCQLSDFACICSASSFVSGLVPCVQSACSPSEFADTVAQAQALCASAGVTLTIPSGTSAPSTVASSSAPASSSVPATTVTETQTTVATTSVSSAAPTTTAAGTTSAAPTTAAGGNATVSTTSPPTPSGSPGAAGRNTAALGGLGAVVALVAAFL